MAAARVYFVLFFFVWAILAQCFHKLIKQSPLTGLGFGCEGFVVPFWRVLTSQVFKNMYVFPFQTPVMFTQFYKDKGHIRSHYKKFCPGSSQKSKRSSLNYHSGTRIYTEVGQHSSTPCTKLKEKSSCSLKRRFHAWLDF